MLRVTAYNHHLGSTLVCISVIIARIRETLEDIMSAIKFCGPEDLHSISYDTFIRNSLTALPNNSEELVFSISRTRGEPDSTEQY